MTHRHDRALHAREGTLAVTGGALPLPKTTFTFISDPDFSGMKSCPDSPTGHGWLIVSPAWLAAVGLTLTNISTFSYQNADGILALEEDCDAPGFLKAFEARFGGCFGLREAHQENTEIRNWSRISYDVGQDDQAASSVPGPKGEITYEIQRCPMIDDRAGGYTLFDSVSHAGQRWEFIDVAVTKRVDDCLVDEIAGVDDIKDIATSDAVILAFASAYPTATTEDHLEGVAHLGPDSVACAV